MQFTIQLAVAIRCRACGRLWNLSGLQVVEADGVANVTHEVDGPCPGCVGDDDPDGGEVAAE